jgi:predicted transcriptional regulator
LDGIFRYDLAMKTQMIEIHDDTATALKQRAEERGLSVPELVAELDRRWKAFEAQDSAVSNDEVVRWLQTWGTPAFRNWRNK